MTTSRAVIESDWKCIAWLASNAVQEADHSGIDSEWTKRRRIFSGERYQSVLENDSKIVGYCALEKSNHETSYRGFLVADWSQSNSHLHHSLFDTLEELVRDANASKVWMRELAGDKNLIEFIKMKGFYVNKQYEHDGLLLVNLEKDYEIVQP